MPKKLPPLHPGEILREEFLIPFGLSPGAVAKAIGVPRTRVERLSREETSVTADTALRLAKFFGTTPVIWMNSQVQFDLKMAEGRLKPNLMKIKPRGAKATARNISR